VSLLLSADGIWVVVGAWFDDVGMNYAPSAATKLGDRERRP
jgi:hypothetical protein